MPAQLASIGESDQAHPGDTLDPGPPPSGPSSGVGAPRRHFVEHPAVALASGKGGDWARSRCWSAAWGLCAALAIGAIAGLLPALRAARLSPTDALRTV